MQSRTIQKFAPYLLNSPMAAFIGVVVGIIWASILNGEFGEDWTKLYAYVITALISLAVAGFALAGVFANIQAQQDREDEARLRKLMAAKAVLPGTLLELTHLFEDGAGYAIQFLHDKSLKNNSSFHSSSISRLSLPAETLGRLMEVIEFHDDPEAATRLRDLLKKHQVALAHWAGVFREESLITERNIERS